MALILGFRVLTDFFLKKLFLSGPNSILWCVNLSHRFFVLESSKNKEIICTVF
jgi:hypothetical protein